LSLANAKYFHVIDAAMFVLCLDDGCPETPEERARQGYIGDGSNRWFDKVLQFYVSANGRSGSITEHGVIDGTTPARLLEWIVAAIDEYLPSSSIDHDQLNGSLSSRMELDEVVLQTTPEVESHMNVLRNRFLEYTLPTTRTYVREHLTEFGTDFLVQGKVSIKGVVDITFQLALRLFFGRNIPSWEPTSAAHYHTGRSDAVQKATPAVVTFCDAAAEAYQDQDQSQHGNTARLAALLSLATKQMQADMQAMLNGRSYMRVFEVLSWLWPSNADTPKPRFLSEHLFFGKPFPTIFAQSNGLDTEIVVEDFATLLLDTEGFWTIIMPEKSE
jgi:Choline/Carnitine o-acyltransferase